MIKTVADLLAKLKDEETRLLDSYDLAHGPTIGSMYEGLTSNILDKAIPQELNLSIVSGFVTDGSGRLSPQVDCMLVRGYGEVVPYTNVFKWHVKDVIAVFEVKKTLYSDSFADSYVKLRDVLEIHRLYVQSSSSSAQLDISSACRAFAQITGVVAPPHKSVSTLSVENQFIYHTLIIEQLSPVRIVLGYNGFRSEFSFRDGLYKYLEKNLGKPGFGVMSFPQLSICGQFSLVKLNGQPYVSLPDKSWWHFLASSNINPVQLMLEFIWTRLSYEFSLGDLWGEDLEVENLSPCVKARYKRGSDKSGWEYEHIELTDESLKNAKQFVEWEPTTVDSCQFVIFNDLCNGNDNRISDPKLIEYVEKNGYTVKTFVDAMLSTGLVALSGENLKLTTELCRCAVLSSGTFVVAEDLTGRFTRWLNKTNGEKQGSRENH